MKKTIFCVLLALSMFTIGYAYGEVAQRDKRIICQMNSPTNRLRGGEDWTIATCDRGERVTLVWKD